MARTDYAGWSGTRGRARGVNSVKRRLLNLLTALSLLLCGAAGVVWVRSYWASDAVVYGNGAGEAGVQSVSGLVLVARTDRAHVRRVVRRDRFSAIPASAVWGPRKSLANRLGFGSRSNVEAIPPPSALQQPRVLRWRMLAVPFWSVVVVFGLLPSARFYRAWRRRRGKGPGHCPRCGYNLTGNVSGVCPECGAEAT